MRYKINVTFQGTATLELEAKTPEAARQVIEALTLADLARASDVDVLTFHVAPREVTPMPTLKGVDEETAEEAGPSKPRPSGWYRPL